jgi:hypothetical protein
MLLVKLAAMLAETWCNKQHTQMQTIFYSIATDTLKKKKKQLETHAKNLASTL